MNNTNRYYWSAQQFYWRLCRDPRCRPIYPNPSISVCFDHFSIRLLLLSYLLTACCSHKVEFNGRWNWKKSLTIGRRASLQFLLFDWLLLASMLSGEWHTFFNFLLPKMPQRFLSSISFLSLPFFLPAIKYFHSFTKLQCSASDNIPRNVSGLAIHKSNWLPILRQIQRCSDNDSKLKCLLSWTVYKLFWMKLAFISSIYLARIAITAFLADR